MLTAAALWFALATAADCATTHVALKRGHGEKNGIAEWLFGRHIPLGVGIVSAAYLAFAVWGGLYTMWPGLGFAQWSLAVLGVLHAVAAIRNLRTIRKGRA